MSQPTTEVPPQSQPQPIPMSFGITGVVGPGGKYVLMQIFSATGAFAFFLDPDAALQFSGLIRSTAKQLRLGLELPPGVLMPDTPDTDESPNGDGS